MSLTAQMLMAFSVCIIALIVWVLFLIRRKFRKHRHFPERPVNIVVLFGLPNGETTMALQINSDSPGSAVTFAATDRHGVTHPIFGVPAWSVSDPAIATITPAADGLSALLVPVAEGECDVTVTIEASAEVGKNTISGVGHVTVIAAEDSQVAVNFGPPQ